MGPTCTINFLHMSDMKIAPEIFSFQCSTRGMCNGIGNLSSALILINTEAVEKQHAYVENLMLTILSKQQLTTASHTTRIRYAIGNRKQ